MFISGFFVFIFGMCAGSFLNVCVHRLPRAQSIVRPPSHCVYCNKAIRWYDNIPLISYILLRGKCRYCGKRIPSRYFLVELLTAVLFLSLFLRFGFSPEFFIFLIFAGALITVSFIDLEHGLIPDVITLPGIACGLAAALCYPPVAGAVHPGYAFLNSFVGVLVGGSSIYAMGVLGELAFRKEAMGGGDVKLMAMIGAFVGWKLVLFVFFLAPFFGSVVGIIAKIKYKRETIPYGPFISLAAFFVILWGRRLLDWLFFY